MKKKILSLIFISVLLTGCLSSSANKQATITQPNQQNVDLKIDNKKKEFTFAERINKMARSGFAVKEITDPNLIFPADISKPQVKKYFKIGDILFALAMRDSRNVVLPLPSGFTESFVGVLVAEYGQKNWKKMAIIEEDDLGAKNNPYYMTVLNKELLLTVVDHYGAGSNEGMMKVFALSPTNGWFLKNCYYFGGGYNTPEVDGDYFAYSIKFDEQIPEPLSSCEGVRVISL